MGKLLRALLVASDQPSRVLWDMKQSHRWTRPCCPKSQATQLLRVQTCSTSPVSLVGRPTGRLPIDCPAVEFDSLSDSTCISQLMICSISSWNC